MRINYHMSNNPLIFLSNILLSIFVSEALIFFLLPYFYHAFTWQSAVINIILLLPVIFLNVYFFTSRTLIQERFTDNSTIKEKNLSYDVVEMCEEVLRETETRFLTLFNESRDAIYIITKEGNFIDFNQSMLDLFGYTREEMLQLNITDLYANDVERGRFQKAMEEIGSIKNFELKFRRKDHGEIDCLVTSSAQKDGGEDISGYHGIIHDFTEHKRIELQLLQAQKMEAVGRLAGGIAHDFNNVLTAIICYANLLKTKMPPGENDYATQIIEASGRAANLTRMLLTFSRKQPVSLKPLNINTVIKELEKLLSRLIGEDVELITYLTERDLLVMADLTQMEQVLMNLATNARDAMPNGGKLIITTQQFKLDEDFVKVYGYGSAGDFALISVEDTGHGIDEKIKELIFDPFFSTKEVGKGTGLGLAMVYGIVKQHNGYINVFSDVNKGTIFSIYLPLITSYNNDYKEQAVFGGLRGGSENLLIVEDDIQVRALTGKILESAGYHVIEAANGLDAVSLFEEKKESIHLLILDVVMPRMNGKECLDEIRKMKPDIKAIFMSGYTADIMEKARGPAEDVDLILKPVSPNDLLTKVREVLDR
jgi:two-component system cell cycle sensor histidine kinase/response regulator CckA